MKKLFRRSRTDRVFAGLCAGFGNYTDTDPVIWRVVTAVLAILSGSIFLWAYLIAWVIVPKEDII